MLGEICESDDVLYQEAKALVYECDRIARTDFENCSVLPKEGKTSMKNLLVDGSAPARRLEKKQDVYLDMKYAEREREERKRNRQQ